MTASLFSYQGQALTVQQLRATLAGAIGLDYTPRMMMTAERVSLHAESGQCVGIYERRLQPDGSSQILA